MISLAKKIIKAPLLFGALFLMACSHSPAKNYVRTALSDLSVDNIPICSGYSCKTRTDVGLSAAEWNSIQNLFQSDISSSENERDRISLAIGLLEAYTGPKSGTADDKPESPFFIKTKGQLDCIDEASNTTVFLHLLAREGLILKHTVETPAQRGFFIGGWPHSTAVLMDKETKLLWAIDSWFHVQGTKAEVVPLDLWKSGWKPEPSEITEASD